MKDSGKTAIIAGIAILFMAIVAAYTYGYVHNTLIIADNPGKTYQNIKESGMLFRSAVLGWTVILLLDILVAWALYIFFKGQNPARSLLMAWLRIIYAAILGSAVQNLVQLFSIKDLNVYQTMNYLNAFENMYSLGLIIFGTHLLELGRLSLKSPFVPHIFGVLLVIAAMSYLFVHVSKLLFEGAGNTLCVIESVLSIPMAIGEIGLALWLLIKGRKHVVYV